MIRPVVPVFAAAFLLSACSTQPPLVDAGDGISSQTGQFEFALSSGSYRCDQGIQLNMQREMHGHTNNRIQLAWKGNNYQLERDPSSSGLPRFEDQANGLVWIDLPWKGLLLDGKTHAPLANECRAG